MKTTNLHNKRSGMTLAEVMVSSVLFLIMAIGVTGLLIQNSRMAKAMNVRSAMTATSFDILEQIKRSGYTVCMGSYKNSNNPIQVKVPDPRSSSGFRPEQLTFGSIKSTDGTVTGAGTWMPIDITIDPTKPPMSAKFFLALSRKHVTAGTTADPSIDVLQVILLAKWKSPLNNDQEISETFRVTVPNPNANVRI